MRRRRKIQYYNGPSSEVKLTQRVWFPFAAVAVAALVLGLILGAIFGAIARKSEGERLEHRDLADYGGVENPEEKYALLRALTAGFVDPMAMSESEYKKALSAIDGNAVGIMMYDGGVHFAGGDDFGFEARGSIEAKRLATMAADKELYSVAYFTALSFGEQDAAGRAYQRGREMALFSEIAEAGFREIMLLGLPTDSALADEVCLYVNELRALCGNTVIGVAMPSGASDAEIAALVGTTESQTDAYALDLRGLSNAEAAAEIEKNAYYITCYAMRAMLTSDPEAAEAYDIKSRMMFE